MFRKPRLKAHLRADVAMPDLVVLRWEDGHEVFPGRLIPLLLPHLGGTLTESEIAGALSGCANILDVRFGLSLLAEKGCLTEGDVTPLPADLAAFRDSAGLDAEIFSHRWRETAVEVVALGALSPEPLAALLAASGVRIAAEGGLLVVLAEDYLDPGLAEFDRRSRTDGRPWLLVKPVGAVPWIGPLFRPPGSACWACLAARLEQNRPYRRLLAAEGEGLAPEVPLPALPVTVGLALHAAATQVLRFLGAESVPSLADRVITLDARSLATAEHRVVRRPYCPHCGAPAPEPERLPPPIVLQAAERCPAADGGYRIAPPDETCQRLAHHVSPLTGLVARMRDHGDVQFPASGDAFRRGAPRPGAGAVRVQIADHVFPVRDPSTALRKGQRTKSWGKGVSAEQARASALCEALERYSGVFQGNEPRITARLADLGEDAVDPALYLGFSAAQLRERQRWNAPGLPFIWVPEPFDRERAVEWSPLWSLTANRFRYLPTACCYFEVPLPEDHRFCPADSNGGAAGNCLEEAILQGFLELVERDAVTLWWFNRLPCPGVDVASFGRPEFTALFDLYRGLGRTVAVLDVTSDFGIPAFAALSHAAGPEKSDLLLGFGVHFDARIALARALTEMNQGLSSLLRGHKGQIVSGPVGEAPYLEPAPGALRHRDDFPPPPQRDLRDEVLACVELARARGLEMLVLDQTREDLELAVVKVVVPGLRPFWPRFAPGRLYDVPVERGWLPRPRSEDEMNPVFLLI
jgi:bacteriocin biosynthesis cyclodehydratase domain-containing protein